MRVLSAIVGVVAVTIVAETTQLVAEPPQVADAARPSHAASTSQADPRTKTGTTHLRLREGSRLTNRLGRFRQNGDSLTFIDEENRELGGLPNLNLERILRMLKTVDEPESIKWSVSGTVTEFSERNYLLITRAVYKAAAPPPTPENLGH